MIRAIFLSVLMMAGPVIAGPYEDGERIYREGILPDGSLVVATVMASSPLSGQFAACARCHRPSGYGMSEGNIRTPAIAANILFSRLEPRRDRLFREMFQERHNVVARTRAKTPHFRPAYQGAADIARAVNNGVDPADAALSPAMPRYNLDAATVEALTVYLRTLGTKSDPGVGPRQIDFATVIGPDVPAERSDAMLKVMQAFVETHNREIKRELARQDFSPYYKAEYAASRRYWRLHVWQLDGPPQTWGEQLKKRYAQQNVFAVLGGVATKDWTPIHRFCEVQRLPCLFPQTDWPSAEPGHFTLYLSTGLPSEVRMVVADLLRAGVRHVTQMHDGNANGMRLAENFENVATVAGIEVRNANVEALGRAMPKSDALVLWQRSDQLGKTLEREDVVSFDGPIYGSGSLLSDGRGRPSLKPSRSIRVAWRFAIPETAPHRIYRLRGWLRARQVTIKPWEQTQLNTYLVLDAVRHAMTRLVDRYSREYLIESIEHEIENGLNPGTYPRLSLGPGQRFAAKGAAVILLDRNGVLLPVSPIANYRD